jgi:hypothetical protein
MENKNLKKREKIIHTILISELFCFFKRLFIGELRRIGFDGSLNAGIFQIFFLSKLCASLRSSNDFEKTKKCAPIKVTKKK